MRVRSSVFLARRLWRVGEPIVPVTQADVAALAGVSRRTVSNVVNDFQHVSASVRDRVEEAIAQLGYTPSQAARSLRTGRSGVIQLIVPELDVPYFAELARGVLKCAEEHGLSVLISQTLDSVERETEALNGITSEYVDGTILSAASDAVLSRRPLTPVVLVGERRWNQFDHVGIDDVAGAKLATQHLIDRGRTRIAFIGADPHGQLEMASWRYRGHAEALRDAGLPVKESMSAATSGYHRADGAKAFEELLARGERLEAVFCATDLLAFGAMSVAAERGFAIPDDIAFVGFDDLDEGRFFVPSLSTISPDKEAIAKLAVEALVRRMAGGSVPAKGHEVVVPFRFIERNSTPR